MNRLAKLAPLALLASAALGSATADAAPASRPIVQDNRDGSGPVASGHAEAHAAVVVTSAPRRHRRRPGPRLMMPLRVDLGMQGANTSQGYLPGVELRAGIHWASLSPKPTNFDVGLGVFGAALVGPALEGTETNNDVVYGGAYLEVGQTLSHGDWWRTWASGRGEYLASDSFGKESTGFGVAGRLTAELYASGVGIEPRGLFLGTYAIGVYAEAGVRGLGDDVDALQVSGGLTFRTPLVFQP
jgi:hypothetical protein